MQLVTMMNMIATKAINTASQRFVGGAAFCWANQGTRVAKAGTHTAGIVTAGIVQSITSIIVWRWGQVNIPVAKVQ